MQTAEKMDEIAYGPIPNAIDPNEFYLTNPIDNRTPQISMLIIDCQLRALVRD